MNSRTIEANDYHERNPACDIPPDGWTCSRAKGHPGPCAASPVGRGLTNMEAMWEILRLKDQLNRIGAALAPLVALHRAATPAPWESDVTESEGEYGVGDERHAGYSAREIIAADGDRTLVLFDTLNSTAAEIEVEEDEDGASAIDRVGAANAELVVAMRNALPALLEALA